MRSGRLVLAAIASLLAIAFADAAAAIGYSMTIALVVHHSVNLSAPIQAIAILACVTTVAGVLYAIFVLARHLPRGLLVTIGLVPALLLAYREYLLTTVTYPGSGGGVSPVRGPADLLTGYGVLAPTVAGAVLGVATMAIALTRRPFPRYESALRAAAPEFAGAGATVLAALAAVGVWVGAGFAEVTLVTPESLNVYRFTVTFDGHLVPPPSVASGPVWVMLAVGAVCVLVAGGLYPVLVSRRLHPAVPLVIAAVYVMPTVCAVAANMTHRDEPHDGLLPGVKLLAAAQVGLVQPAVTGAALLLAVPLVVAGVVRLRERANRPAPVPSSEPRVAALV